jgi:hypothetical protein
MFSAVCNPVQLKKADAEPVVMPIKTLMRIHLSSSVFCNVFYVHFNERGVYVYIKSFVDKLFSETTAVNSISTILPQVDYRIRNL